ncbi:MAG TPA: hypothetical protein VFA94_00405 [Acidimicrobiales bacterium]|nr:hypothetical protein [Acidimicrobiales bacterium]
MRALTSSFWLPRAGNDTAEYEDAFHPRKDGRHSARRLRFAMSDGAGESMLSGRWAELLTRTWCKGQRTKPADILHAAMSGWDDELSTYLADRQRQDRPIQWFEEPGLAQGAFATLLGLQLTSAGGWTAVSMGDTCLFQVRDQVLVTCFPLQTASDFGSSPNLVPSRPEDFDRVVAHVQECDGDWRSGDTFFLATDAIAHWFLDETETGGTPWKQLGQFDATHREAFGEWVAQLRMAKRLRNDDVTLVRIDVL